MAAMSYFNKSMLLMSCSKCSVFISVLENDMNLVREAIVEKAD